MNLKDIKENYGIENETGYIDIDGNLVDDYVRSEDLEDLFEEVKE